MNPDFVAALRSAPVNDDDLKASLLGGWNPHLPAIQDERGTLLVGNRRMVIATANDIAPVLVTIHFGDGPEADAARARLAVVSNVGASGMTPTDRKRVAGMLYGQGMTQEAIAQVMGVSQRTISSDLSGLEVASKPPRPKGGRPKASKPKALPAPKPRALANPEAVERERVVASLRAQGKTTPEIAAETGLHERNVAQALEHAQIDKEGYDRGYAAAVAEVPLDPTKFYKSAQDQAARLYRQYHTQLYATFQTELQTAVRERLGDLLERIKEREAVANRVLGKRRGLLQAEDYNLILRCLHPDTHAGVDQDRRTQALNLWLDRKPDLLSEKVAPMPSLGLPNTVEEMLARKQQVKDARSANLKARRAAKQAS